MSLQTIARVVSRFSESQGTPKIEAGAADRISARTKKKDLITVLPTTEVDEVNRHLVQVQYLVREWVIRANGAQQRPDEYSTVVTRNQ